MQKEYENSGEYSYCGEKNDELSDNENSPIEQLKEKNDSEKQYCIYCGSEIEFGKTYCSKCGRSTTNEEVRHCTKCGTELILGQKFCSKCGQKAGNFVLPKNIDELGKKVKKANRKKIIAVVSIIALIFALVIVGKVVLPKLFISSEEYLSQGNYEKAYEKAETDEKKEVLIENLISYICNDIKSSLKDIDSFKLREAYFTDDSEVVLMVQGANSYGSDVSSYWCYTYDKDDKEYQLWTTVNDFDEEKTYSWDDFSDRLEAKLKNATKEVVKNIINKKENKLDSDLIKRINDLNKAGKIDDVKLIEQTKEIFPQTENDNL